MSNEQIAINTLRMLAVDMVEAARSGHPGAPMGQAPLGYRLFTRWMRHDPKHPEWPNRDRFVLSCGHASALIYGLLHLSGYDLPLDQLRNFRQLGSHTPGHPEHGDTPGVETTTGPLGQGLSTAVGMALAERLLAERFNSDDHALFDHRVWVLASDGDLMEGITSEAASLAGHLKLGKLIVFWDDNRISIDGGTDLSFTEDVVARHAAYGWHTLEVDDVNDLAALDTAVAAAAAETGRPTLIRVRTVIGHGSPNKAGTAGAHGAPLGPDEVELTKEYYDWPQEPTFHVPDEAKQAFGVAVEQGSEQYAAWTELHGRWSAAHPELAAELDRRQRGELPEGFSTPSFEPDAKGMATRKASGKVLDVITGELPELVGGSADLTGSNNTLVKSLGIHQADNPGGRYLHYGVREHAMGAAATGMALSGLLRPYVGTFLVFSDYMRPAIRLAALMKQPVIYVFTHDSIFLGEDGPTHQPVSHLASLRSIPGLDVYRPADAAETSAAWDAALRRTDGPSALILTRQGLQISEATVERAAEGVGRGAYVLVDHPEPSLLLLATGSEVDLALHAHCELSAQGIHSRIISMPCWERFEAQDEAYREQVLPAGVEKRVAIEAALPFGWHRWVGSKGDVIGQEGYGASAPYEDLAEHFGFTVGNVVARAEALIQGE